MTTRFQENDLLRKTRWLTQALILSGTLNIGLLTTFAYFVLQDKQSSLAIELKPAKKELTQRETDTLTNKQILKAYSQLPFQELLLRLDNKEQMEEGLCSRDLALTCLITFHHFNLEKALGTTPIQKRSLPFVNSEGQERIDLPVFPGLSDDHFQAIQRYAKTEKWPLTGQGLFYELKRSSLHHDPSLVEAFSMIPEYHVVETLFSKTGLPLSKEQLMTLLCEGDWKNLTDFSQTQRQALDLSIDRRRALLLSYLNLRSKTAAKLLLESDLEFSLKRFDDSQILTILDLFEDKFPCLESFAKGLLVSPRTDMVWKKAATVLFALAQEPLPEPYDHRLALQRFFPTPQDPVSPIKIATPLPIASTPIQKKLYTIEQGDNLWKIARKFHVSIDELKRVNHLETEKLKPGKQLEIPTHK